MASESDPAWPHEAPSTTCNTTIPGSIDPPHEITISDVIDICVKVYRAERERVRDETEYGLLRETNTHTEFLRPYQEPIVSHDITTPTHTEHREREIYKECDETAYGVIGSVEQT